MNKKALLLLTLLIISFANCMSQTDGENSSATPAGFSSEEFSKQLLLKLNKWRHDEGLDTLEVNGTLFSAADHHSADMAINKKITLEEINKKYKNTGERVKSFGGTKNAEELVFNINIMQNGQEATSENLAIALVNKWKESKKERPIILKGDWVYIGISNHLDQGGKKGYVSVVFGGFKTFNNGAERRKTMKVPYTKKIKKIKAPVNATKECKNCDKFKDYERLAQGLTVDEKGVIWLEYPDLKMLKKLIRKPKDGFSIDVVQRSQYDDPDYNIYDNNLPVKGVLLKKPVFSSKIYSKNKAPVGKGNKQLALKVQLGKFPKKITGDYELNLIVLQEGKICKTLRKNYVEQGTQESNTPLDMLLMPDSDAYLKPAFKPTAESTILTFLVPFEKNKYDYKQEDIKPLLDALQEPDYIIDGLYIYAYSSIEGDSVSNAKLQQKRAESIIQTFKEMTKKDILTSVKTNDSWDLFRLEMDDGKFADLTNMKKNEAINKINNDKNLLADLEPYLAKQRFAQVILDIVYDIKGAKEEKYCTATFNKAIKKEDFKTCYKIQYFIEQKVTKGDYKNETLANLAIENKSLNSGLINNRIVYRYLRNNKTVHDEDLEELKALSKLDPANTYAKYNYIFADLKAGEYTASKDLFAARQSDIEALYNSKIPKKFVDGLNIELQFKMIQAFDTIEGYEGLVKECTERIKGFYNFKESTWQNSLKLAYVFAKYKDYRYASQILEPYILKEGEPDENVLFAYISFCAQVDDKLSSRAFATALEKAAVKNKDRYCLLFGQPKLSFQILDNPFVKRTYIQNGCVPPPKE